MSPQLPPPDPYESSGSGPGMHMPGPAAIFMAGPPSAAADRLSDTILDFRPGALFIAVYD